MIITAYYNNETKTSVNINFDIEQQKYTITRTAPGDFWRERTTDREKAKKIASNFIILTPEQLNTRVCAGISLAD